MATQFQNKTLAEINRLRSQLIAPSVRIEQATKLAQQIKLLMNVAGVPIPSDPNFALRLQQRINVLESQALTEESRNKFLDVCGQIKAHKDLSSVADLPLDQQVAQLQTDVNYLEGWTVDADNLDDLSTVLQNNLT